MNNAPLTGWKNSTSLRRILLYLIVLLAISIVCASGQGLSGLHKAKSEGRDVCASQEATDTATAARRTPLSPVTDTTFLSDTLRRELVLTDTITETPVSPASDRVAFTRINRETSDIDGAVIFSAQDSMVFYNQNEAFMFGNSTVEYGEFKLNAGEIRMVMDSSTVYARAKFDSINGTEDTYPVFRDRSGEYESRTMAYNFKTQRGFITDVTTQQGEGYLTADKTKKNADGSFYVEGGRYTTCDNHDHPHFYFQLTRAKVIPKKNIVTGPAYMVLADVPLPLALPFGYFPFSKDYSSGIIFPSFGDDYNKGFYLRDGGYYFAISDNIDLALRGEIYTKGSWGVSAKSTYVKRYKFRGTFDASYITTITGDKGAPDYMKANNFRITWTHQQDAKANPYFNFSASVNFTTSGYTRNDLNSYYSNAFTENTKSSTINLTYRPPGSKWSFSANTSITQRTQDSTLAISFPNITVTLAQMAPFKRKRPIGGEKWYEKIRISYSAQIQNTLTAHQNQFFKKSLVKDWRNGISHQLPIQATFTAFKYFNITPSVRINDRMYFQKVRRAWDPNASTEVCDTSYGLYNVFDFSAQVAVTTKVYGFYKPWKIFGDKVQMIRHVMTPTISFSGSPDFSSPFWGIYDSYYYPDAVGNMKSRQYSMFQNSAFGAPSAGKTGMVSFSLGNNLEMKVKSDSDSTGMKKISLIESFTIGQSYNFAADSLRFSNISTSLMLRVVKGVNLNLQATWDPYMYALSPSGNPVRVNKLRIAHGKGFGKLSSTGTSFSYTFNNDTFRRKKNTTTTKPGEPENNEEDSGDIDEEDFSAAAQSRRNRRNTDTGPNTDADGYAPWACPWSLTVNYSVNYGYGEFNVDKLEYKGKWTQNLSVSGNIRPTPNWNFSMSASYNFDLHKIAYMNCSVSRDLHCFTMTASFIPVGPYKSFNFHIAVKASMLKDLKWDKRSSVRNGINWY